MSKTTQTVPFSFDELFEESRNLFANAGFDVADGSNTSQLAAVMSYLVSSMNTNTAMNINETLLPYATKRNNILQDARVLGYEPQHATSYQYKLTIKLGYNMIGYGKITIPKYTKFVSNDNTYVFIENNDLHNSKENGIVIDTGKFKVGDVEYDKRTLELEYNENNGYIKTAKTQDGFYIDNLKELHAMFERNRDIEIPVKEGEIIDYSIDPSSLEVTIGSITVNGQTTVRNYIDIPYTNVENDGINVYVSYYDSYGNYQEKIPYNKVSDYFFEKDSTYTGAVNHKFIRIDDIEMGTPRIYFKYAGLGEGVPFGSVVQISILKTKGADGELNTSSEKYIFSLPNYDQMYNHEQTEAEYREETASVPTTIELNVFSGLELPELPCGVDTQDDYIKNIFADAQIIGCDLILTGADEESSYSIQQNAPKVYNSANRLITKLDYKYACNRSPYVYDSSVWGGEDEFPKAPGHIWFSFMPEKSSTRQFISDNNNTEYQRTNNQLVYNYAEGDSTYQTQLRNEYYRKNYILNTEIKGYRAEKDENGTVVRKYSGVWGDLIDKCVPSLTFHHRHPIYMNFNYNFNILKYNIKDKTSNVHKKLFDALNACFYGDDSLHLENFDVEYFHTNIVKRLDYLISDLCGFTSTLETQLILNEKTLSTENWKSEYKDVYIPLGVPFEKYFTDDGFLDPTRLPSIDTENFINFTYDKIRNEVPSEYDGLYVGKYGDENALRFSLVTGDLYTDWSTILTNTANNKILQSTDSENDYSDISTKMFIAPIKIKMKYRYLLTQELKDFFDTHEYADIQLGFRIAPDNTIDESYNGVKCRVCAVNASGQYDTVVANDVLVNGSAYETNYEDRSKLKIKSNLITNQVGKILEIEFTRTCGYYYLNNTFNKDILIHLFVNGDHEGFKDAANGMRTNTLNENMELYNVFNANETTIYDNINYIDVTYSNPRAYLYTSDKKYITTTEEDGGAMEIDEETEIPANVVAKINSLLRSENYSTVNGTSDNRYITTEGYLVDTIEDVSDTDYYTGEIIRNYKESDYLYTPLTTDLFRQNVYLNVKYPSTNFKVIKNVVPRLNNVKFKNAVELY